MHIGFGRNVRVLALVAAALLSISPVQSADGPPVPDPADLIKLVHNTMLAVVEGNAKGDYTSLHAMGSQAFQRENTPQMLAEGFKPIRVSGFDLSAIASKMPLTTRAPTLDRNGRLRILGYYDLLDRQVVYDVIYDFDHALARWQLAGISVTPRVLPPQPALMQPE